MGIVSAIVATFKFIVGALGTLGVSGAAANIIAGVVTAGIAVGTARQLGTFLKPNLEGMRDNGTRVQLPPATDNKIPVIYGTVWTSGPIIDVAISNSNKTMHYCLVLSEETDAGAFSLGEIWWNDAKLIFGSGASAHVVTSRYDKNATTDTNWNGKIRMRAYAGSTNSADQIFPVPGGGVTAVNATTMMPHWTNTTDYNMNGIVFLMIEVDYSAEDSLQGLGALTLQVTNSLKNPGEVLDDYLSNNRYGAGLTTEYVDFQTISGSGATSMKSISNELVPYTPAGGGSSTQKRYEINGVLNTFDSIKTNINKICVASSAYFLFDGKSGKFKVKMNHSEDTSSAFVCDDDNIVSDIKLQSTSLFDSFNQIQVEFADTQRKDQTNTVFIETPAGQRMANEPDNILEYRIDMINNNIQAKQLANIDLAQSRKNKIVQFAGDHSTLQVDIGDVIKVTNSTYGLSNSEFRVMRLVEKEDDTSVLTTEITALEYDSTIFANVAVTQTQPNDPANANIYIPSVLPTTPVILPPSSFQSLYQNVPSKSVTGTGTLCSATVLKALPNVYSVVYVTSGTADFSVGDTVVLSGANLGGFDVVNDVSFTIDNVSGGSIVAPVGNITGVANLLDPEVFGSGIATGDLANLSVGSQIEDKPAANLSFSNADVINNIFTPRELDFTLGLDGLEPGDYSFIASGGPIGQLSTPTANFAFTGKLNLVGSDGTNYGSEFGSTLTNFDAIPTVMTATKSITIPQGLVSGNVVLRGKNTLNPTPGGDIGFNGLTYDFFRINKGDIF